MINYAIKHVLRDYNIDVQNITPHSAGGKNNDLYEIHTAHTRYILKRLSSPSYTNHASIQYELDCLLYLNNHIHNFAIPLPVQTDTGNYIVDDGQHPYILLPHYQGTILDLSKMQHIDLLASVYGEIHTALIGRILGKRAGQSPFNDFFDFAQERVNIFSLTPSDLGLVTNAETIALTRWWNREANIMSDFLATDYQTLPKMICHNDITPGNVIQADGAVTALLDFEFITQTPRAFDIATSLRHVMRIWETPQPWDKVIRFFSVYNQWQSLSEREVELLPNLLRLRSAIAIIWWLGQQTNLESVPILIGFYQSQVQWLGKYSNKLIDIILNTQK